MNLSIAAIKQEVGDEDVFLEVDEYYQGGVLCDWVELGIFGKTARFNRTELLKILKVLE